VAEHDFGGVTQAHSNAAVASHLTTTAAQPTEYVWMCYIGLDVCRGLLNSCGWCNK